MLSEDGGAVEEVCGALTNIADTNEANQRAIGAAGAIAPLVALVKGGSENAAEEAAGTLMNLGACDENKPRMAKAGVTPCMVQLLSSGTDGAREHAAGTIANLCNGQVRRGLRWPPRAGALSHPALARGSSFTRGTRGCSHLPNP